ncbi:polyphosphate polymerase domain-containing protein [candidate division KSB1 bacterium]|nr:polyphosphate polymerase domain-containing protein [candidate division KSB1 bacterium]
MRFEYKFLVHNKLRDTLRAELQPFVVPDHFICANEKKEYTVRSIYFDTRRFDFYHEKLEGLKVRKKIRLRGYDQREDRSRVFLEIKKKIADHGYKHRAQLYYKDVQELFLSQCLERSILAGDDPARAVQEAGRFFYHVQRQALKPVVLITYDREAFQGKLDPALRITFDKRLRYRLYPGLDNLYDEQNLQFVAPHHFILEIKFQTGFSVWLQAILKRHLLQRSGFSKYAVCLEASQVLQRFQRGHAFAFFPGGLPVSANNPRVSPSPKSP